MIIGIAGRGINTCTSFKCSSPSAASTFGGHPRGLIFAAAASMMDAIEPGGNLARDEGPPNHGDVAGRERMPTTRIERPLTPSRAPSTSDRGAASARALGRARSR
jgi:hypothetical protein